MDDVTVRLKSDNEDTIKAREISRKRKLESILLLESIYSTTVQIIIVDLSWATAGLTSTAILYTIDRGKVNEYIGAWIFFFISIVFVLIISIAEFQERVRRVLRAHDKHKAVEEEIIKKNEVDAIDVSGVVVPTEPTSRNTKLLTNAIHAVEAQTSEITRNAVTLIIVLFGNVLASALNNVVQLTAQKGFDSIGGSTLIMLWLYAIIVCILGTMAAVRLSEFVGNNSGYDVVKIVEEAEYVELKHDLLTLSHMLRLYRLFAVAISLCMAWAVRDAVKYTIMKVFYDTYQTDEGTPQAVLGLWIYAVFSAVIVSWLNMMLERKGYVFRHRLDFSRFVRKETQLAAYLTFNVFQTVVGLAIYDALIGSFEHGNTTGVRLTVYWLVVICCMTISITGTFYLESYKYMHNRNALYEQIAKEDLVSQESKIHDIQYAYTSYKKKNIVKEYARNWIELWINAIGIAGSLAGANAVAFSLMAIYGGIYDPTAPHDPNINEVWSLWLSVLLSYAISAVALTYLSKSMDIVKKKKRKYAEKVLLTQKLNQQSLDMINK